MTSIHDLLEAQGLSPEAIAKLQGAIAAEVQKVQAPPPKKVIEYEDLTQDQKNACDGIVDFLAGPIKEQQSTLIGYSGTGKTTVTPIAIKRVLEASPSLERSEILLAGPTHKACRVLRDTFSDAGLDLEVSTYASMLGMKGDVDHKTGLEVFVPDPNVTEKFGQASIIVCDEGSWVSPHLKELIEERISFFQRILWMGDDEQIPYIHDADNLGENDEPVKSPVFDLPGWRLREVVRYEGNLARLAEAIRSDTRASQMPNFRAYEDRSTVFALSPRAWYKRVVDTFTSEEFGQNPDKSRVLVWRNDTAAAHNRRIHQARFGEDAEEFCVGEVVIAHKPCLSEPRQYGAPPDIILNNGAEAEILGVEHGQVLGIPVFFLDCITAGKWTEEEITLKVVSLAGRSDYDKKLQSLRLDALKKTGRERGRAWAAYYEFYENFHQVNLAYAITGHKGQGSTYEEAFIDVPDIACCRGNFHKTVLRNRLLYTVATRASSAAYFKVS